MNTSLTSYRTMDDLVFENRNHSYGAYFLRKKYDKHLSVALGLSLGVLTIGLVVPQLLKGEESVGTELKDAIVTVLQPPPLIPQPPMERFVVPPPPPPPAVANIFHARLVEEEDDIEIPTNEDLNRPTFNSSVTGENGTFAIPDAEFGALPIEIGEPKEEEKIFMSVEEMPKFAGDLGKFLQKHLRYPQSAIDSNISGRVYLSFVVGKDGAIADIQVAKGIQKDCDAEAMRVVALMPNWKPGKQSGRAVAVRYSLPIVFQLGQ